MYFHLITLLKWSLKYLSEYRAKREFSWVSKIHRVSEIGKYTKELREWGVWYYWKYEGLKIQGACNVLIAEKTGFLSNMIMENLINFFLKKKVFMPFFSKNDFDLLSVFKSDTRMLWGRSILFWIVQTSFLATLISIKWFT